MSPANACSNPREWLLVGALKNQGVSTYTINPSYRVVPVLLPTTYVDPEIHSVFQHPLFLRVVHMTTENLCHLKHVHLVLLEQCPEFVVAKNVSFIALIL